MKRSKWRVWLGGWATKLSFVLSDPHDTWVIEYRDEDGKLFGAICTGHYSVARVRARELGGKIIGFRARTIPADM